MRDAGHYMVPFAKGNLLTNVEAIALEQECLSKYGFKLVRKRVLSLLEKEQLKPPEEPEANNEAFANAESDDDPKPGGEQDQDDGKNLFRNDAWNGMAAFLYAQASRKGVSSAMDTGVLQLGAAVIVGWLARDLVKSEGKIEAVGAPCTCVCKCASDPPVINSLILPLGILILLVTLTLVWLFCRGGPVEQHSAKKGKGVYGQASRTLQLTI